MPTLSTRRGVGAHLASLYSWEAVPREAWLTSALWMYWNARASNPISSPAPAWVALIGALYATGLRGEDVAAIARSFRVVAVNVGSVRERRVPQLDWRVTALLSRLGGAVPNPATAKLTLEMLLRAVEIMLERQTALAVAMTAPEIYYFCSENCRDCFERDPDAYLRTDCSTSLEGSARRASVQRQLRCRSVPAHRVGAAVAVSHALLWLP